MSDDAPTLIDELRRLNIPYKLPGEHHHAVDGWIQIDCPQCGPGSSRWHLGINIRHGHANCYRCGRVNVAQIGLSRDLLNRGKRRLQPEIAREKVRIPRFLGDLGRPHRKYLKSRGFNPKTLATVWGLRAFDQRGGWRLFVPFHRHGEIIGYATRGIGKKGRWLSATTGATKGEVLYGEDYVRDTAIVVEGPADAWAIGPGAVALLGLNCTVFQINRLLRYRRIVLCLDNEPRAQRKSRELMNQLISLGSDVLSIVLESGDDPGSADRDEIAELRKGFL